MHEKAIVFVYVYRSDILRNTCSFENWEIFECHLPVLAVVYSVI